MALNDTIGSAIDKKFVDFSQLYDTYFTSANVKVYMQNRVNGKIVQLDAATGIGYSHSVSSVPIHVLGSRMPITFSRGNVVGQGMLNLVFKDALYMKVVLKHLFDEPFELPSSISLSVGEGENTPYNNSAEDPLVDPKADKQFYDAFVARKTIGGIIINEGMMTDEEYEKYKELIMNHTGTSDLQKRQGLETLSIRLDKQRGVQYKELSNEQFAKTGAKSIVGFTDPDPLRIKSQDILDVGSIHHTFDIRIVLNNTTPYYNHEDTYIILRDCKFINESIQTSSLQDSILQHNYQFMFKTVTAG